ncbi:MAG: PqqD family protein [bacterium]|nr:PqqD family protein [bacterium]
MSPAARQTSPEPAPVTSLKDDSPELKDICFLKRSPPEALLRSEEIDGKMLHILYHSLHREAYTLKATNKLVWDMIDGKTCVQTILIRLYSLYGEQVEPEQLWLDVTDFLEFLWEREFILTAFKANENGTAH